MADDAKAILDAQSAQWHWEQGIGIAVQGLKLLFILNGGSAIAILAYLGRFSANQVFPFGLVVSMLFFGLGAFAVVVSTAFAYRAQLGYGNSAHTYPRPTPPDALRWTKWTWRTIALAAALYLVGVLLAAVGFLWPWSTWF